MPDTTETRVQFAFARSPIRAELEERARSTGTFGVSDVARRDLERYYALLERCLPRFGEAEASLILDALNGILTEPHSAALVWANVADAIRYDGLDQKWAVDGPALIERLRALSPFEQLAIADACERAWNRLAQDGRDGGQQDLGATLRHVGLVRPASQDASGR